MKKLLSILLTIAFFQSQLLAQTGFFPFPIISVAGAATAASSSYGTGMYAAGFANYETNKLSLTSESNYGTQGNIFSNSNINFTSGKDMMQEGTNVYAQNGTLTYDIGNDLTIKANKDTYSQERKTENISGGVSVGNNAVQVGALIF